MRSFGHQRVLDIVRSHLQWARDLAEVIAADPQFEVVAPVPMSLVCFRYKGTDDQNRRLLDLLNTSGVAFLSGNVLNGQYVLRLAIGNLRTTREDVFLVWRKVLALAGQL
jgi:aromatic-L-amino-acid decarboxylase